MHTAYFELTLSNQHLVKFGKSLFALMPLEFGPKLQLLVDDFECLTVVPWQLYFFPKLVREVGALNSLHVKIANTLFFEHGGVSRVSKRTRVP
jgi:hypothetical protein